MTIETGTAKPRRRSTLRPFRDTHMAAEVRDGTTQSQAGWMSLFRRFEPAEQIVSFLEKALLVDPDP